MKRSLWLIFAAVALVAAGVLVQDDPEPVAVAPQAAEVEHPPAAVRVSHEFITVPISTARPEQPLNRQAVSKPHTMLAGRSSGAQRTLETASPGITTVRRANRSENILEKARRAFVGDGRHRPEPFPRIRDN